MSRQFLYVTISVLSLIVFTSTSTNAEHVIPVSTNTNSLNNNLNLNANLIHMLRERGWNLTQDSNGHIFIQQSPVKNPIEQNEADTTSQIREQKNPSANTPYYSNPTILESKHTLANSLHNALRNSVASQFWLSQPMPDGSLKLYPIASSGFVQEQHVPESEKNNYSNHGTDLIQAVHNSASASDVALEWVQNNSELSGKAIIGKIREVPRAYMVSVVSNRKPYKLLRQIAVRSRDGKVIVID